MRRNASNTALLLTMILLLTSTLTGCEQAQSIEKITPIRPVKLLTVESLTNTHIRSFPAKTAATKQVDIAFRVPGQLIHFDLVEGQTVNKGDVLARLDDRDANNALLNSEASFELASADFKRKGELLRQKLISEAEYDTAKATKKTAKAALANAQDQLSYTKLIAPYSGTIAKITINNFQMVQVNQPLLTLQKDNYIDVVIQVPESLINTVIHTEQHIASVVFSSLPSKTFPAKLKEFASQVSQGTQSYEVVFTLPQPKKHKIFSGMSAELSVDITTSSANQNSVTLPAHAISKRDSDGKNIIWLFDSITNTVLPHEVELGKISKQGVQVIGGLNQGDQVVVAGVQYMSAGLVVKPIHWQRGV